jgi:hypothetical protein
MLVGLAKTSENSIWPKSKYWRAMSFVMLAGFVVDVQCSTVLDLRVASMFDFVLHFHNPMLFEE